MQNQSYPNSIGALYDPRVIYTMPLYQREYCWENKELKNYRDDLEKVFHSATSADPENIFLGAIVLKEVEGAMASQSRHMTVIDGQQRLTTMYLTIAALSEYAYDKGWTEDSKSIIEQHLVSNGSGTRNEPVLKPTAQDTKQFYTILQSLRGHTITIPHPGNGEAKGKLKEAYEYISESIVNELILEMDENTSKNTFDNFLNTFLNNFVIADITLSKTHNANEVFDRLNQRGQRLGVIDLIRNDLFGFYSDDLSGADNFYQNHWLPFQQKLGTKFTDRKSSTNIIDQQIDNFFFPFAVNKRKETAKGRLLTELHDAWGNTLPEDKVKEMNLYIEPYFCWLEGDVLAERVPLNYSDELRRAILDLKSYMPPRACLPFLMRCLKEVNEKNLLESDAAKCFRIIEVFLVRRTIVFEEEGTGYDKIFKSLWENTKGDPVSVRKEMPSRTKTFPSDKQFKDRISEVNIYGKRIEKYLLFQYEKHLKQSALEYYPKQIISTTDHINPQTIKGLNAAETEEHKRTVGLWGNLLPMSQKLNSTKSNRKLSQFKNELKQHSAFETTKEFIAGFVGQPEWTPTLIDKRTKKLADWAVTRWPD